MSRLKLAVLSILVLAAPLQADDPLEKARARHARSLEKLDNSLQAARRTHADGIEDAHRRLLESFDKAIERARKDDDLKRVTRLKAQRHAIAVEVPRPLWSIDRKGVFESVLGHYGRATRGPRGRFINLRPPTSANLWTAKIQQRLRGRLNFAELDYIGSALLVIKKTGWYRVELAAEGTSLKLNGRTVSTGRIQLRQGVYDVEIHTTTWGGPYLKAARVAVFADTGKGDRPKPAVRIPFVNTTAAIRNFVNQRIEGRRIEEVTDWTTRRVSLRADAPRGRILSAPNAIPSPLQLDPSSPEQQDLLKQLLRDQPNPTNRIRSRSQR